MWGSMQIYTVRSKSFRTDFLKNFFLFNISSTGTYTGFCTPVHLYCTCTATCKNLECISKMHSTLSFNFFKNQDVRSTVLTELPPSKMLQQYKMVNHRTCACTTHSCTLSWRSVLFCSTTITFPMQHHYSRHCKLPYHHHLSRPCTLP